MNLKTVDALNGQRKIQFQKRFDQNWIKNYISVRVYFWTLFANLDFLNFIACAILYNFSVEEGDADGVLISPAPLFPSGPVRCHHEKVLHHKQDRLSLRSPFFKLSQLQQ